MSDEKKYTVDDILAEFKGKKQAGETGGTETELTEAAPERSETKQAEAPQQNTEEYDNYEDGEEQDLSADLAQEPMFTPAGLFDSDAVSEEQEETDEGNEDFETSEEIFADENSDDEENTESDGELLEETEPEADDPEPVQEEDIQNDSESGENSAEHTWAEQDIPEEITDIDVPEETEADSGEGEDPGDKDPEGPEEAAVPEVSGTSGEPEDVNDKWLARFAKGIFPVKGDSAGEVIRKMIFLAALIVFIGAGVMLVSTLIQSRLALDDKDKAKSIITTTVASYIDENGNVVTIAPSEEENAEHLFNVAEYYRKINPDYVGYLEVEGCDIYEPVVQGEDNDHYLKTNISGGYNKAGTVFMDYRCIFTEDYSSPNIVLYGHNQEDGTMFGNLKEYKQNVEFYREHPTVKFSSEFKTEEYLIYGFFVTHVHENQDSSGEVFHYHDYIEKLNDEYTFNWYINEVQKRNQIISPVDVEFGDKLLCLSTCSNEFTDSRFVVFARKLREGETAADYDFSKAYMNPNAAGLDWDAIITGDPTYSPATDIIEEITEEAEEATTREKSNNKTNSGNGSKSGGEPSIVPPAPVETTTTTAVPETETETKKTTTTASAAGTETESSDTESQEQNSSETEAPVQETEQTETAA